jgi:transcriptional regulator with XRE-family HTH domain
MPKKSFIFTKEMAELLKKIRIKAGLSQSEVAERIGLSSKTKDSYISHLEKGRLKNPALGLILLYLRACGESWPEFFKQLDTIDFKMRHEKMIAQVHPPPTERKIQRDAMRYEIGIEFPSKEKEEIDFDRLKKQIKDKVLVLLIKNQIEENQINSYQKFALEYFEFLATLNKAGMKMVADKYQRAGLKLNFILKIKKVINSILRGEIKRISAKKPLLTEKQEKMAIGLTKYRIIIEQFEAEAHKLLCEEGVPTPLFSLYKDFVRECYRAFKQHSGKMYSEPVPKIRGETLEQTLNKIIQKWVKEGLKEDVLLKLKVRILSVFTTMRMKGMI